MKKVNKESFYFPHDTNAIQDPKMMMLLSECGLVGIGAFWIIIEILHQQPTGRISEPDFKRYLNFYGRQGSWDQTMLDRCEKVLFETNLLVLDQNFIFSPRVIKNKRHREKLSKDGKINAFKRWGIDATPLATQCDPNAIKERKGKEIKEKTISTPLPLTDIQKVVLVFKIVSGFQKDDKDWDKMYFSRCASSAKKLIDFLGGWKQAGDCIQDIYEKLTAKGLTVTLETICKHSGDWKKDHQEKQEGSNGILSRSSHGSLPVD